MMEKIDRACSVAFTGHRLIPSSDIERVRKEVRKKVRLLYAMGFRNFISGMALGFDMLAAEEVLHLKNDGCKELRLIAVVPFWGQSDKWREDERKRYSRLLDCADDVVVMSSTYFRSCFFKRNDYMLSHACGLVTYYDGKPKGGTFYTVRRAQGIGMDMINVY